MTILASLVVSLLVVGAQPAEYIFVGPMTAKGVAQDEAGVAEASVCTRLTMKARGVGVACRDSGSAERELRAQAALLGIPEGEKAPETVDLCGSDRCPVPADIAARVKWRVTGRLVRENPGANYTAMFWFVGVDGKAVGNRVERSAPDLPSLVPAFSEMADRLLAQLPALRAAPAPAAPPSSSR